MREYCAIGALLPGMAFLVRRLLSLRREIARAIAREVQVALADLGMDPSEVRPYALRRLPTKA